MSAALGVSKVLLTDEVTFGVVEPSDIGLGLVLGGGGFAARLVVDITGDLAVSFKLEVDWALRLYVDDSSKLTLRHAIDSNRSRMHDIDVDTSFVVVVMATKRHDDT